VSPPPGRLSPGGSSRPGRSRSSGGTPRRTRSGWRSRPGGRWSRRACRRSLGTTSHRRQTLSPLIDGLPGARSHTLDNAQFSGEATNTFCLPTRIAHSTPARNGHDRSVRNRPRQPARETVRGHVTRRPALGSAELLGERNDDAVGATEVAEAVHILILRHLTDEFGAVRLHAGDDVVEVVDREHDAT
jgi:hypothetical protein